MLLEILPGLKESEYQTAYASTFQGFPRGPAEDLSFLRFKAPRDRISKIRKAKEYREIDIINRIVRIRVDFGLNIKGVKVRNKNKVQEKRQQQFYNNSVLPLIKRISEQWEKEHNSVGDVFLHFAFHPDERTPMFLTVENPENVNVVSAFGTEIYKVKLPSNLKNIIKELKKENQLDRLPGYISKQLKGKSSVLSSGELVLTQENMFRTSNLKTDYEEYSEPPLMAIAEALELRKLLTNADFVSAYSAGSEIIHTKVGTNEKPANQTQIKEIHENLTNNPPGVFYFTTRHDVEIKRINPNTELWKADKYEECNNRILQWSGISVTIINGEGSAYGSALVSVKGFQQSVKTDKKEFERFTQHFFEEVNRRNGWANSEVKLIYDRDALVENKDFMEQLKYLVGMGIAGIEDVCFEFDMNYDEQLEKKKKQKKDEEFFQPHFEMNQGRLKDEVGRPKTNPNNTRETNQPKPSGS